MAQSLHSLQHPPHPRPRTHISPLCHLTSRASFASRCRPTKMKEKAVAKKLAKCGSWRPHTATANNTIDLRLSNLAQFFGDNPDGLGYGPLETGKHPTGTGILVWATRSKTEEPPTLVLHTDLQEGYPPTTITLKHTFISSNGGEWSFSQSTTARLVRPGVKKTWATLFGPAHQHYKEMVADDRVICRVTVRVPQNSRPLASPQQTPDLIHAVMTGGTPKIFSTKLFVYQRRNRNQTLSGLREVRIIPDELAKAAQTSWDERKPISFHSP